MRYATFGKTGLSVSQLGLGAWGIGRSMWRVEANARAIEAGPLSEEQLAALRPHRWAHNFHS